MTVRSDKHTWRQVLRLHWRGARLLSRAIPHLFTAITLHTVVATALPYITVWLFSRIIGELSGARDENTLRMWVLLTVLTEALLLLLGGILKRFKEARWECLYRSADSLLSDKLLSMDHADVDDRQTKELLSRVREDMSALGMGLVHIPDILQNLLSGVIGAVSAAVLTRNLFLSPLCAAAMAAVLVLLSVGASCLSRASQRVTDGKTEKVVPLDRSYYAFYNTMFDNKQAADIRLYGQDALIVRHLEQAERLFFDKDGLKRRFGQGAGGVLRACSEGLSAVWLLSVYLFVATKALGGAFAAGDVLLYIGALSILYGDVAKWCRSVERRRVNAPYLETVLTFLELPHRMYQGSLTTEKRADGDYELEFRHVSFRYPDEETYALYDVSLTIRKGDCLAIVGENGSGKSTFVKLLCRLYDPDEGEILLGGIDIRKYRYADYIALIAAVFQDFQLLPQPLGYNVAGAAVYDREKAERCLDDAGFGEQLYLWERGPDTLLYHSVFGEGELLSLGEEQKIAIARALYKDAPFIVLDEPTAALDPVTEAEIYERLGKIVGDRTAVYISHRLSSCRFCKEILVFDRGSVIQRGTHEELVKQTDGKYSQLWSAQAQYYMR